MEKLKKLDQELTGKRLSLKKVSTDLKINLRERAFGEFDEMSG